MGSPRLILQGSDAIKWKAFATACHKRLENVRRTQGATIKHQMISVEGAMIFCTACHVASAHRIVISATGGATLHAIFDIASVRDPFYDYTRIFYNWEVDKTSPWEEVGEEGIYGSPSTFPTHFKPLPDFLPDGSYVNVSNIIGNYGDSYWQNLVTRFHGGPENTSTYDILLYNNSSPFAGEEWAVTIYDIPRVGYEWSDLSYNLGAPRPIMQSGAVMVDGLLRSFYFEFYLNWHGYLLGFDTDTGEMVESVKVPDFLVPFAGTERPPMLAFKNHQTTLHDSHGHSLYSTTSWYDSLNSTSHYQLNILDYVTTTTPAVDPEDPPVVTHELVGAQIDAKVLFSDRRPWRMHVSNNYLYFLDVVANPAPTYDATVFRIPRYDFWRPLTGYKEAPVEEGDPAQSVRFALSTEGTLCVLTCVSSGIITENPNSGVSGAELIFSDVDTTITDGDEIDTQITWDVEVYAPVKEVVVTDTIMASFYGGHLGCAGLAVAPDDSSIYTLWRDGVVDDLFYDYWQMNGEFSVHMQLEDGGPYEKVLERTPCFEDRYQRFMGATVIGLKYK